MQPKHYVNIRILDEEVLPEQMTEEIGINPSKSWHKGDIRPKTCIKEKNNGWELQSCLAHEAPLVEHIDYLLSVIKPVHKQFQNLTQKYYAQLSCIVYFDEELPELSFDKYLLKQLTDLNLSLDIDIYNLSE
jgi:hypothetical protein